MNEKYINLANKITFSNASAKGHPADGFVITKALNKKLNIAFEIHSTYNTNGIALKKETKVYVFSEIEPMVYSSLEELLSYEEDIYDLAKKLYENK